MKDQKFQGKENRPELKMGQEKGGYNPQKPGTTNTGINKNQQQPLNRNPNIGGVGGNLKDNKTPQKGFGTHVDEKKKWDK